MEYYTCTVFHSCKLHRALSIHHTYSTPLHLTLCKSSSQSNTSHLRQSQKHTHAHTRTHPIQSKHHLIKLLLQHQINAYNLEALTLVKIKHY